VLDGVVEMELLESSRRGCCYCCCCCCLELIGSRWLWLLSFDLRIVRALDGGEDRAGVDKRPKEAM